MKKIVYLFCLLALTACAPKKTPMDVGAVTNTEWRLEYDGDRPVIDASQVTVTFKEDGALGGRAGCNNYFGTWKIVDDKLEMGPIGSTKMMCPEALMEQEMRFLRHLGKATTLELDDTGALLIFVDGMEKPMLFRE